MRIIGVVATYNEELAIAACLEHHIAQGIELYLLDNESTDHTVAIAQTFLGRGLLGIESVVRRQSQFDLNRLLTRKQELAFLLDADWFIHLDADEMRLAPDGDQNLAQAIGAADAAGYNAINFLEFTFIPTVESPDHAHGNFKATMRWYYPFLPQSLHRVNGWKKQPQPVDLVSRSGHFVSFPGQFIYPLPFRMCHYQFLSVDHAIQKYAQRRHPAAELAQGKHGWREQLDPASIRLPAESELHELKEVDCLDFSHPRAVHFLDNRTRNPEIGFEGNNPQYAYLLKLPASILIQTLIRKTALWVKRTLRIGHS